MAQNNGGFVGVANADVETGVVEGVTFPKGYIEAINTKVERYRAERAVPELVMLDAMSGCQKVTDKEIAAVRATLPDYIARRKAERANKKEAQRRLALIRERARQLQLVSN